MTEAVKISSDIPAYVRAFGVAAREAGRTLASAPTRQKNEALLAMAEGTAVNEAQILAANRLDMDAGKSSRTWLPSLGEIVNRPTSQCRGTRTKESQHP